MVIASFAAACFFFVGADAVCKRITGFTLLIAPNDPLNVTYTLARAVFEIFLPVAAMLAYRLVHCHTMILG
jgi:hypothetical protein